MMLAGLCCSRFVQDELRSAAQLPQRGKGNADPFFLPVWRVMGSQDL